MKNFPSIALYFPISAGTKRPAVKNWQAIATDDVKTIQEWVAKGMDIGAMPKAGYFVLDLDVKEDKNGIDWIANNRPALPATWTAKTARGGQHHWFKLPAGVAMSNKTDFQPGLDIRAAGRGYIVFEGSYEGKPYTQMPFEGEIPEAPQWIIEDAKAKPAKDKFADDGSAVLTYKGAAVLAYNEAMKHANALYEAQNGAHSWDDAASELAWYTAHLMCHADTETEREELQTNYLTHPLVEDLDANESGRGSNKLDQKLNVLEPQYAYADELEEERESAFFASTEMLSKIEKLAKGSNTSPWAVLGHSLAMTSADTHHNVLTDPDLRGSGASLNFFLASVGNSGDGKGEAYRVGRKAMNLDSLNVQDVGSGEALLKLISDAQALEEDTESEQEGKTFTAKSSVFVRSDEITDFATKANRSGSTIFPRLLSIFMGAELSNNTVGGKANVSIADGSYRCVFDVDVQPRNAGALLEHQQSGLPQRFVWVSASSDKSKRLSWRERRELNNVVSELGWTNPFPEFVPTTTYVMLPDSAKDELDQLEAERAKRIDDYTEDHDGHLSLVRIKVASLLAILHGQKFVSEDIWKLSAEVMRHSAKTLDRCMTVMDHFVTKEAIGRAKLNATIAHHAHKQEEELSQADMPVAQFAETVVLPKIQEAGKFPKAEVNKQFRSNLRTKAREAMTWLVAQGLVGEEKEGRTTYYLAA